MPTFLLITITAVIIITAAVLYISKIINSLPVGRAQDFIEDSENTNQRIIACIGDSLTHGNIGQSWVDYLRKEFPEDIFLNEGINGNTAWQVLQRLEPILEIKPDIVIVMIGSNDSMGSFDKKSGVRYMRNNNLPEVPTFDKYKEHFSELIERLNEVPKIGLCTIPPIGENQDSMINKYVEKFNDYIKSSINQKNIELLPVSDEIWSDISKRTYPFQKDYDSNAIPIMRRIFGGIFHHYLLKKSWNDIAKSKGQWILFDQIHFNERGAKIVFKLVKNFIS